LDWQSAAALGSSADLFQSFGGDVASVAPLTNDWLFEYGLGDGNSLSGGEGDGILDGTLDGGFNFNIDWLSLVELGSSHEATPILGSAVSPASLDDLVPSDDSTFLFNSQPDISMPSATLIPTPQQPGPYSMSPPTLSYDQVQQPITTGKRRSPPVDHETALKRQRNNVAARKYRQKRIDRINELELELDDVKQERDDLKIRLARQEAETAALRTMLQIKSGEDQKN